MNITLSEIPDLVSINKKMRSTDSESIRFLLPQKIDYWTVVDLRIISTWANELGKEVFFVAQGKEPKRLLALFKGEAEPQHSEAKRKVPFGFNFGNIFELSLWKALVGFLGLVLILAVVGVLTLFYFWRATVIVRMNSSSLVKNREVLLDPTVESINKDELKIPAIPVSVENADTFEKAASGSTEVGNKATGDVVTYNYDTKDAREFSSGSPLISSNDLRFFLNADVELSEASSSADPDDPTKRVIEPSTVEVKVTAESIGSQYNIDEDTKLYFEELDEDLWEEVYTVTNEDLSGGESRTVSVATKEDQDTLLSSSLKKFKSECEESLSGKLVGDQKLSGKGIAISVLEKIGIPAIKKAIIDEDIHIIIIDEIGKMEMLSELFCETVVEALDSDKPIMVTLHKKSRTPLLQDVRRRDDIRILEVTPVNRNLLPYKIEKIMKEKLPPLF